MILFLAGKYQKLSSCFMAAIFAVQIMWPITASSKKQIYPLHATISPQGEIDIFKIDHSSPGLFMNVGAPVNSMLFNSAANNNFQSKILPHNSKENEAHKLPEIEKTNLISRYKPDIGGPGQPEMSGFQSVNGNNMVDLFTGDFSYNIPLMDVGGYPINIHYSSGITMDQEASWVGLGFNINPGTINRNMRGLPDDFSGADSITKIQNIKINKTVGVKLGAQAEWKGFPLTVGAGFGVFHNNYNGWGIEQSLNAAISLSNKSKGSQTSSGDTSRSLNLGMGINNNSQTGLSISPSLNVKLMEMESNIKGNTANYGISTNYHTRAGLSSLTINAINQKNNSQKNVPDPAWGASVNISFAQPAYTPSISMPTTSQNFAFHAKTGFELYTLHPNVFVEGYVNKQEIKPEDQVQKLPAYGYLYYTHAKNNPKALLDFNREKELQFNYQSTPNIAIPQYTYDVYAISGEGTGGTIRPYRGDAGFVSDHQMRTKSSDDQFSAEIGFGNLVHGGLAYDFVRSFTENSSWTQQNNLRPKIDFQKSDSLYQSVYFRNPTEKTSNTSDFYRQVGNDALIRVKLNRASLANVSAMSQFVKMKDGRETGLLKVESKIVKKERDKRSQLVTYKNAAEATLYGLNKNIYSYKENTIPIGICQDTLETILRIDNIRKENHLSEIDVLNSDGRRYVYGIPAYNIEQRDVTFSVNKEDDTQNIDSGLVIYSAGSDNTVNNNKGKESYFNQEIIPAYAHSFLLTGILSPDYVDIREDGITEDDLGDAVRFNYTRVYGPQQEYFEWRTPGSQNKANYNEGFKTYSRDDKGLYFFGKKEVWYTHSIESKTMIALFKVSPDRKDAFAAIDINGGINKNKTLRKLDRIELYTKADLIKNGTKAKPVKVVHFEYNYELCKGYNGNADEGKLTLKKIWFSYNGNEKGKQNPYNFNYQSSNPGYHPKKYDRWGNYKSEDLNPGALNNADYPYALQDSVVAAQNAGVWHLTDIKLPSGGRMKISFEADDYGFVQNKRATQMFSIAGFGKSPSGAPSNNLYGGEDYDYVFVNSSIPLKDENDIFKKYLEGNTWIYLKIAVTMPPDRWGNGYEFVPVYGKIADYGKLDGTNQFWIRFEKVQGVSPMLRAAFQFLKNNLPSKAYPTSELGDNVNVGDAVKMLLSSIGEIKNAVVGFEKAAMSRGWCKNADLAKSFIRLNSPLYKKLGGGIRVKKIEVFDNWNAMANQKESVYGQEYIYRTSVEINGETQIISSGVASYEPMIGNEENPFRQPIAYAEKIAPLAPVSYLYSEMPLGESYFPGANVGYGKVRVRTINAKVRSANGWEETEFYTSKDFPTIVEHTLLDQDAKARYKPKLLKLLKIYSVERTTVSQGFKIELNDMNGKVKRNASYAENDPVNPISYSMNFYKVDDDKAALLKLNNTVWVVDSINGKINKNGTIGKDIELITDFRQQYSFSTSGGISPNLDVFMVFIFPVPIPSLFKFPQFDETLFRSAATVKVIHRYGILDSVIVMDKGSIVSTKNLLYDGETGEVLLSRKNNEFNDPLYHFNYPAHWAYSGMGMAYKNVDAVFTGLKVINGKLYYPGLNVPFPSEKYFESGDELWANGQAKKILPGEYCLDFDQLLPGAPFSERAWVINAGKGKENDQGLFLINKQGVPYTGIINSLKVLRSGKRNMLNAAIGNLVLMDNPVKETSMDNFRIVIDSAIRIIHASVATFKDVWKVENTLYEADSCFGTMVPRTVELFPKVHLIKVWYDLRHGRANDQEDFIKNNSLMFAGTDQIRWRKGPGKNTQIFNGKSILEFDHTLPKGSEIINAHLYLAPREPRNIPPLWPDYEFSNSWNNEKTYFRDVIRNHTSVLKRIPSPWNENGDYENYFGVNKNSVELNANSSYSVNIKKLLQDIVDTTNNGILFQLKREPSRGSKKQSRISFLNYAGNSGNYEGWCSNHGTYHLCTKMATGPRMVIQAMVPIDTCVKVCRNNINDSSINPYRWGVFGNWRMDRAYTYYSDRKEMDASITETDIRREGALKNFSAYWKFTDKALTASGDTSKWVWNSAISDYNRKGFETENYDPLGRYNAGRYGYNQTLPVAIAQNSRYSEMLYDGFEDYDYKTKNCTTCESPRDFDFVKNQQGVSISEAESHTGKYSIKVNAGSESKLVVPIKTIADDSAAAILLKVDPTPFYMINVVGKGKGLTGTYTGRKTDGDNNCTFQMFSGTRVDSAIDFNWGAVSPYEGMCFIPWPFHYNVFWQGKVQAKYTGLHTFYLDYNGIASLTLTNGPETVSLQLFGNSTAPIYLTAGKLYDMQIGFTKRLNTNALVQLSWSHDMEMPKQIIPKNYLYPANTVAADTVGSVRTDIKYYCIKLATAKPHHVIRPTFSPFQDTKMIVSAWVKMDGQDCNTAPALNDVIIVSFDKGGDNKTVSLQKTGVRIEGWQRYESKATIPKRATQLYISLKGGRQKTVFIDDIRMQPFSSNMKNYVYDPVNLRLMAELDENNYAAFYEYDDDGTLVRIKKETEKGIMTVKETRSALLKEN